MEKPSNPSPYILENQLCFAVQAASHAFTQAYKPLLAPLNLTYPQYLVMLLLWEKDNRSVSELGAPLFLDSGTLTPLLKRLQTTGYITRGSDPKDERITRISLTPRGIALKKKAQNVPEGVLCATGLDIAHLVSLREAMKSLGESLRTADSKQAKA